MTKVEFENVIAGSPTLTTHGFGIDGNPGESFELEREKLSDCYDEALACEQFLQSCLRTKKPHKQLGSTYGLKHAVERFIKAHKHQAIYILEGALIAAALFLGFQMMPKKDTTSVYLNISMKTRIDGKWIYAY